MGKIYFVKLSLLALCFAFSCEAVRSQTISLQLQNDYTVGMQNNTPRFAVGDVNSDGLPDLVTLNPNNDLVIGPIVVFLNNGVGGFGTTLNTPNVVLSPTAVVIRDFNGDGCADLAVSQTGIADAVNIRLGNCTGNFPTGTALASERGSPSIVSADFNGDGFHDLATCTNTNQMRVLSGNGAGGFALATFATTASTCQDIITADFNVDGRPDVAVAMRVTPADRGVQVFLNNGAGFNAALNIANAFQAEELISADFNRDCIPDLAVARFADMMSGTPIFILLGNGAGNFTLATTVTVNNFPRYMTVGDFNRDKKVDLALRRNIDNAPTANNLTILPGDGAGGFGTPFEASIVVPTTPIQMHIATIDANLDGKDDLIIGKQGGFLLYHGSSALFTRTENDFDADGRADVSVYRPSAGDWFIQRSTQGYLQQHWGISADKLVPADYDGDGKTDIAVWRENGYGDPDRSYFFILQSSTNTFRQEQFGRTGDMPTVVGDWDGDGKADVAVYRNGTTAGAQSFFYYRPSSTPGVDFISIGWGVSGDRAVRGDFDGDRRIDAAIFRPSTAVWYVLQSSSLQAIILNWGLASDRLVPADYDGDTRTDFAVFRPSQGVWYVLNSSTGTASIRQWGISTDTPVPADYNGDGLADTAVYRSSNQVWYVPQCGVSNGITMHFGASGDVAVPAAP